MTSINIEKSEVLCTLDGLRFKCPDSTTLYDLLSCFDPDNIPLLLLHVDRNATVSAALKFLQDPLKAAEARRHLSLSSLIWETDEGNAIRYYQADMDLKVRQMGETNRYAAFRHALQLLSLAFPEKEDDFAQLQKLGHKAHQLLIHVDALVRRAGEEPRPELGLDMAMLLDKSSYYLMQKGEEQKAETYADLMDSILEPMPPGSERNSTLSSSYHLRGRLLHVLGNKAKVNTPEQAYELEKKAMALRDALDDADPYDVAASWGQLAIWAMATEDYDQSLVYSEKCLEIRLRDFPGEEVENLSVTYQNLGHCLKFLGRFEEAEEAIREALAVIERKFGGDCKSVAQYAWAFYRLGSLEEAKGNLDAALAAYRRGLDLKIAAGDTNPYAAEFKVAYCLMKRGDLLGAEEIINGSIMKMRDAKVREDALARALYLRYLILSWLGDGRGAVYAKLEAAAARERVCGIRPEVDDNLESYTRLVFFWDW